MIDAAFKKKLAGLLFPLCIGVYACAVYYAVAVQWYFRWPVACRRC